MKFSKPPTTIDEQIQLLQQRGMKIEDVSSARRWLETVGYYRLSAYWLPFEEEGMQGQVRSKTFKNETTFQDVTDLYVFDRHLRLFLLEIIERVEVHMRSRWTYHMAHEYGPHAHLDHSLFISGPKYIEQLARLTRTVEKSEETFVVYYKGKYSDPYLPPLWAATELLTLGELSKWFQITKDNSIKSKVGKELGLPTKEVSDSVFQVLSYVRNICAHHGRLWNRKMVKRLPKIKRLRSELVFDSGEQEVDKRLYNVLVVLLHMLDQQSTDSTIRKRLVDVFALHEFDTLSAMGFPPDWQERATWRST